uniref:Uncharacterized protein n=1 Tax=Rhizophagus irregularis (strain DAOM 181602 / DAOM 197198 / MUCL 43194) TaxID=747089 RepID=U9UTK5_RHIID
MYEISHGWVQGLEYIPVRDTLSSQLNSLWRVRVKFVFPQAFLNRLRVIAITQLDGFVPTGCQTSCYVMNERSSGNVLNFWTTISKKRRINITRADGVLRMLEGTTAEQQHVFNIQQQDLLGLYQPSDDDLFEEDHQPKTPSMRPRQSEKDVFESAITASLNPTPAHPFQQVRKTILYDL